MFLGSAGRFAALRLAALGLGLVFAALPLEALPSAAQTSDSNRQNGSDRVLVVSLETVLTQASAAQQIQAQANVLQQSLSDEIQEAQTALRAEELELTTLRETLDPAVFEERVAEFRARVSSLRRESSRRGSEIQRAVLAARRSLREALTPILQRIRRERGADILLERGSVIDADPSLDITQQAIAELDRAAPAVSVTLPEGARGEAGAGAGDGSGQMDRGASTATEEN